MFLGYMKCITFVSRTPTSWSLGSSASAFPSRKREIKSGKNIWYFCNTRFIKEHKPSNHIRARIKSHVYTTEWTVYHTTYHVKRYNKANTNVIYYNNDKNVWYSGSEVQNTIKSSPKLKQGATGTSTGRRTPRSPRSPGSAGRTPSCRQELSSSSVTKRKK